MAVITTGSAFAQSSASTPDVTINWQVLDQLAPRHVQKTQKKPALPAPAKKGSMPKKSSQPDYSYSLDTNIDNTTEERSTLKDLQARYFPQVRPAIPAPTLKPHVPIKQAAKPKQQVTPVKPAQLRKAMPDNAKEIAPQQSNAITTAETTAEKSPPPVTSTAIDQVEPQGEKMVSIAYVDNEIQLNINVQNALLKTYIPQLNSLPNNKRIKLYSHSSIANKSTKEANRLALERASALKEFLVRAGIAQTHIDIFPIIQQSESDFSDWIDIML